LSFLSPSAQKTSLCLRHAIWRKSVPKWIIFGIPESLHADHGSDFTSEHIDQLCVDLKIRLINSTVGCSQGRGKIERLSYNKILVYFKAFPIYNKIICFLSPL